MNFFSYIFYIFYKIAKKNNSVLLSDFVSLVCILTLQIWFIAGILNEIYFLFDIKLMPSSIYSVESIIGLFSLVCLNVYIFVYKSSWKTMVEYIEKTKTRNKIVITWLIVVVVIINCWLVSLHLLSLKACS